MSDIYRRYHRKTERNPVLRFLAFVERVEDFCYRHTYRLITGRWP